MDRILFWVLMREKEALRDFNCPLRATSSAQGLISTNVREVPYQHRIVLQRRKS